jgi:RHS repeat-associated protein
MSTVSGGNHSNQNMTSGLDTSAYTYDAQNRLTSVARNGTTETFKYDALNRIVSRTINGATYYNVWDHWNLLITYDHNNSWTHAYFHGPDGVFLDYNVAPFIFETCYNDASGSTTHIANGGTLLEWYRYDLDGNPLIFDANNNPRSTSAYDVRFLFTGQQWYSEVGLYDLRNRFYSPDIGRFLQPDPASFDGDATNLYRYCGNNPTNYADSAGDLAYNVTGSFPNFSIQIPIRYSGPGLRLQSLKGSTTGSVIICREHSDLSMSVLQSLQEDSGPILLPCTPARAI